MSAWSTSAFFDEMEEIDEAKKKKEEELAAKSKKSKKPSESPSESENPSEETEESSASEKRSEDSNDYDPKKKNDSESKSAASSGEEESEDSVSSLSASSTDSAEISAVGRMRKRKHKKDDESESSHSVVVSQKKSRPTGEASPAPVKGHRGDDKAGKGSKKSEKRSKEEKEKQTHKHKSKHDKEEHKHKHKHKHEEKPKSKHKSEHKSKPEPKVEKPKPESKVEKPKPEPKIEKPQSKPEADPETKGPIDTGLLKDLDQKLFKSLSDPDVTVDDLARYIMTSPQHFYTIVGSLALDYAKVTHPSEPEKIVSELINKNPTVPLTFNVADKENSPAEMRALAVSVWTEHGVVIPPALGRKEDPLLDIEPLTKEFVEKISGRIDDGEDMDSESFEEHSKLITKKRKEAVAINDARKVAFNAMTPEESFMARAACSKLLRARCVAGIATSHLLPWSPMAKTTPNLECSVLFYNKDGKTNTVSFVDNSNCDLFYCAETCKYIIKNKLLPFFDQHGKTVIDSLSLARYVKKCIATSLKSNHGYTSEQTKAMALAVGEEFYFAGSSLEDRAKIVKAAFGVDISKDWLSVMPNPSWTSRKIEMPDREVLRNKSRSKDPSSLYGCVKKIIKEIDDGSLKPPSIDVTKDPSKPEEKPKKKPVKRAPEDTTTDMKVDSETPAPKEPVIAKKRERSSVAEAANGIDAEKKKLAELLKKNPEITGEARIIGDFFFIDKMAPSDDVDKLAPFVKEVAEIADCNATVRTAQQAVDKFSVATQEQNTTSTQHKEDGDQEEVEEDSQSDDLIPSDFRFAEKICAKVGIGSMTFKFALLNKFSPKLAKGLAQDLPDLVQPTPEQMASIVKESVALRNASRSGTKTTRRFRLTHDASRASKPAQGRLTSPKSDIEGINNIQKKPEAHEDVFAKSCSSKSWLLIKTAISSIDGATASVLKYGELMDLRDSLREGGEFTLEKRWQILITESLMPAYVAYTISQMQNRRKIFGSADYAECGDDLLRTIRYTTRVGSGFPTWMANCLIMTTSLAVLASIARSKKSQVEIRSQLSKVPNISRNFNPLIMWEEDPKEGNAIADLPDDKCKPIVDAFFGEPEAENEK